MAREILFRGKRVDNGKWEQGFYFNTIKAGGNYHYIHNFKGLEFTGAMAEIEVIPETIGQYIGLVDEAGTKIFEGDIIKFQFPDFVKDPTDETVHIGEVIYDSGCFSAVGYYGEDLDHSIVIGNIHDHPELIKI